MNRRNFLATSGLGVIAVKQQLKTTANNFPLVISTWDAGIRANVGAWQVLQNSGKALDAVEQGVMITETEKSCCVGLQANPDRDGVVTLDASIMDHQFNCGAVGCLERIEHPISVARKVMENTPHVLLVGKGAQDFALSQGFKLQPELLSDDAQKAYKEWLKKSNYKPIPNIENSKQFPQSSPTNHDTIAMLAMDEFGNLAASCTTSGMAFKMHGRLGDSPIVGAGIYVDNEVGAACGTGQGEDCIRIAGSHSVVSYMEQGFSPEQACKKTIEKILKIKKSQAKDIQLAYIAINKKGEFGSFALQYGFSFAVCSRKINNKIIESKYLI
ncbi:MAG: N(4)-(beta-N-acetylglucosaminyl)-L-asparaginase [Sediminibacterium sp.]|nr:N(4)-(beta-N-acetylglucosaminyl)-L-asparaginase [Sediminibacterium sp.]